MRIALLDPSLWTLPYDDALAAGLRSLGHEVTLYGRHLGNDEQSDVATPLVPAFYPLTRGQTEGRFRLLRQAVKGLEHGAGLLRLGGQFATDAPDVVHVQWLPLPLLDRPALQRLARRSALVLTMHDSTPFNGDAPSVLTRLGIGGCLGLFDQLIVHTRAAQDGLLAQGVAADRIAVVPHGVFGQVQPTAEAAAPCHDPDAPVTFLLFGKIKHYKGADLLIRAFASLPPTMRARARLRIVGKPYLDIATLQALAAELGVTDAVAIEPRFVADAEIPALMRSDVVSVFPYRAVDASGVLALALAHGRPILASRLGIFAELLEDGRHGLLVPPGDVAALGEAMSRMLTDPGLVARSATEALALARSIPGWDEIGRRTVQVYHAAIAASRRRLSGAAVAPAASAPRPRA